MEEVWVKVDWLDWDFDIDVSNFGNIKKSSTKTIRKLNLTKQGYYHISLSKKGKTYAKKVHRLVAQAFIPNPENKPCVNHRDGNKLNNNVSNLEWVTYSENSLHALENKLSKSKKGEEHSQSKLSESQVIQILNEGKYDSFQAISNKWGVDRKQIEKILKRTSWTHIEGYEPVSDCIFNNFSSKLTKEQVYFIRNSEKSVSDISKILNIHSEAVRRCKLYETYKNV
jgi:hypothetical protein